jgi:hypothetical protein
MIMLLLSASSSQEPIYSSSYFAIFCTKKTNTKFCVVADNISCLYQLVETALVVDVATKNSCNCTKVWALANLSK